MHRQKSETPQVRHTPAHTQFARDMMTSYTQQKKDAEVQTQGEGRGKEISKETGEDE